MRVLGIERPDIDENFPVEEVSTGFPTLVVPLKNLAALKRAKINKDEYFSLVSDAWAKIILVFSPEGYEKNQNLSVRVFGDYYGIVEDAATGSSNGCLAAYLAHHKRFGSSSVEVCVGQGYEMGRPSTLLLRAHENKNGSAVFVGGSVVEIAEGLWG